MAEKSHLLVITLFLAGLVARGAEARIAAIIYGAVPCTVQPNQANVRLEISDNSGPITANNTRTNNEGEFVVLLNVTSNNMMDSLVSGGSKVVVTTPPVACNASLPATGTLDAPVFPPGARILGATPVDNTLRDTIDELYGVLSLHVYFRTRLLDNATMDTLRQLTDRLPTGVSYDGNTLDAYAAFSVGSFSYSAGN